MASIKIKQSKQAEAATSRLTPRSQKKSLSVPSQPAPVPDMPTPLAELPPEGSEGRVRRETSSDENGGLAIGKNLGLRDGRNSTGKVLGIASRGASQRSGGRRRDTSQ